MHQFQSGQSSKTEDDKQKSLVDKWAEELSGQTKPADDDFWKVLEDQWDDMYG